MIVIKQLENFTTRTWGWIQDAADLSKLADVIGIFDNESEINTLVKNKIEKLVLPEHGKERFLDYLNQEIIIIPYKDLCGTNKAVPNSKPKSFYCTGIVQATITGQKREYIRSWPADNYVRFALTLGLLEYDYENDTCYLSDIGKDFVQLRSNREDTSVISLKEKEFLSDLLLSYPPAVRILELLSLTNSRHLSKFEISEKMAFVGEAGFITYPVDILLESIAYEKDPKVKNKMRTDWESTLDKYARMISGWLESLDFVRRVEKKFNIDGEIVTIGQSYKLTGKGYQAFRKARGMSRHAIIPKRISWEMLATKEDNKERLRTRRALILKKISESTRDCSYDEIYHYINENDSVSLDATINEVKDDLIGLRRLGLNIELCDNVVKFKDQLEPFVIPVKVDAHYEKSNIEEIKSFLKDELVNVSHDWLQLVDLSYDGRNARIFEMQVVAYFKNVLNYEGEHLGGASEPDGALWKKRFGIVLDTKAYKDGFPINTDVRRQMEDYLQDVIQKDDKRQSNRWWEVYPEEIIEFSFLFVSSFFKGGNYREILETIQYNTNISGGAISAVQLLLIGERILSSELESYEIKALFTNHDYINETSHLLEYNVKND